MSAFVEQFLAAIAAGTPYISVNHRGQLKALTSTIIGIDKRIADDKDFEVKWRVFRWTPTTGLTSLSKVSENFYRDGAEVYWRNVGFVFPDGKFPPVPAQNAFWLLNTLHNSAEAQSQSEKTHRIILLPNFDKVMFPGNQSTYDVRFLQWLEDIYDLACENRMHLVFMSSCPFQFDRLATRMVHLDYPMPTPLQIRKAVVDVEKSLTGDTKNAPSSYGEEQLNTIVKNASGLTHEQLLQTLAIQAARTGKIDPESLFEAKKQIIEANSALTIVKSTVGFSSLGGLQQLKDYAKQMLTRDRSKLPPDVLPKGIVLVGVPGTGKSAFAKVLGWETNRLTIMLDLSRMRQGIVGGSEAALSNALHYVDVMSPSVVFIDEIEKMIGSGNSSHSDGGVDNRMLQRYLTWASDRTSDAFVVATSNDISRMPDELFRSGRFDAIFFVDVPTREEKDQIWDYYNNKWAMKLNLEEVKGFDSEWTGADVEQCCRTSLLRGIKIAEAARTVVPVALKAADKIAELREKAKGTYLSASYPGVYQGRQELAKQITPDVRRTITKLPSKRGDNK